MIKYRDKTKIKSEIIQAILKKKETGELAKQQHIIYGANMNFKQARTYIPQLVEEGFITEAIVEDHKIYDVTPFGIDYLKAFKALGRLGNQTNK